MAAFCVHQQAFESACWLDIATRKPGNVSLHSHGHNMEAQQFLVSASVSAPALCALGRTVGKRIEAAVSATWQAVGCNTNLGILLLCAPLLHAWGALPRGAGLCELREGLNTTLAGLTVADAEATYRAITMATPAGLGEMAEQDVHGASPTINLRDAMRLAENRDEIARQYVNGFEQVLSFGLPVFLARLDELEGHERAARLAMRRTFLHMLAHLPDTHIIRKYGRELAQGVMIEARAWLQRDEAGEKLDAAEEFHAWDEALKKRAINPGTTADFCVAIALAAQIARPGTAVQLRLEQGGLSLA
ncbi:triphosphoribosyl-dephospho-CoA synthase [Xanthobacter sp. TB0139]|uniref:triphosphoribosyl-dephospho-CoA synthase n=1 Tax=Xanthobacter sp. TB0139 TaxID=3459178 RepID=UPI00403949F3